MKMSLPLDQKGSKGWNLWCCITRALSIHS